MEEKFDQVISDLGITFTETGIYVDAFNAWHGFGIWVDIGAFERLEPVQHYSEYFEMQDKKYAESGNPGLLKAIMARSNPETVAEFDSLVDEFNSRLPDIISNREKQAVQEYIKRVEQLKNKSIEK